MFSKLTDRASIITSNILRGCQSGTVRGLLDRNISEGHLQSSNESMKTKLQREHENKNDKNEGAINSMDLDATHLSSFLSTLVVLSDILMTSSRSLPGFV